MGFKPNYRQQRAERDRQARAKQAERLKKLHEKSEQRKAEQDGVTAPLEKDQREFSVDHPNHQTAVTRRAGRVESTARPLDLGGAADLFFANGAVGAGGGGGGYRRFSSAAEAIRFAIEGLPASRLLGVFMQVGDTRFDAEGIRLLYEHQDYPLERSES